MKPLLPNEVSPAAVLAPWRRLSTAMVRAAITNGTINTAAESLWDADTAATVIRSASGPASLTGWGSQLSSTVLAAFLRTLAPQSAAARLFDRALSVRLTGANTVSLPRNGTAFPAPSFVVEGAPIPAVKGSFASDTLGPPRKMAFLCGLTGQLAAYSADVAETVISNAMDESVARGLDVALFSTAAASTSRPAGLLNGVSALTATTGGGVAAMNADLIQLAGAIADAGGGTNLVFVANPRQAMAIKLSAGTGFDYEVIGAPTVTAGTVIAVDTGAIVTGFSALPRVDASKETTIVFDDSAGPVSTAGSPNVVAAPVRNAFQEDLVVLRLILPCAWAARASGLVQYIAGTSW